MIISTNIVARFNHWDPKNKKIVNGLSILIASVLTIPTWFAAFWILTHTGYSLYIAIPLILFAIPAIFLHELIHWFFQWVFSRQKPQLGFKFPFAFSKLGSNASISRNQGLLSAISPFLFITVILAVTAFFVNALAQVAIIFVICLHTPTCSGDFHFTRWLLRYPSNMRLRVEDMNTIVFYEQKTS